MSRRVALPGRLLGAAPEFMLLEDDEELCDLCLGSGHGRMEDEWYCVKCGGKRFIKSADRGIGAYWLGSARGIGDE